MVRAKKPESFEKKINSDFEIFRIFYVTPMPGRDCSNPLTRSRYRYSFTILGFPEFDCG